MATKQFYATGAFKYGTRMMRAGDPVEMDSPTARLYTALGKISPNKPRIARQPAASVEASVPAAPPPVETAPAPAPKATAAATKAAPKRAARKTAKRKTAGKK
jgi:hypothetical protein